MALLAKITSVGITVQANGEVNYDGTEINGSVLKVAYWAHATAPIDIVTITVMQVPPPGKPAGLTATPGNAEVALRWTDPGDSSITKYQYQQRAGIVGAWGTWMDISGSGATTTSHTVTGLDNGTAYAFRVRAVNTGRRRRTVRRRDRDASCEYHLVRRPDGGCPRWRHSRLLQPFPLC